MHKRLSLYRNRIAALRADRGTPEWHEAKAAIREYYGHDHAALAHRLAAGLQRLINSVAEMVAPAMKKLNSAFDEFASLMETAEEGIDDG